MVHSVILLNDGKGILLNDAALGFALLNAVGVTHGQSGGRVKKRVGRQLVQGDLGPRPEFATSGESLSKITLHISGLSKSKLHIISRGESSGGIVPYLTGYSNSKLLIKAKNESKSQLLYKMECESWGITHPTILLSQFVDVGKAIEKSNANQIKIAKIHHYMDVLKEIDKMDTTITSSRIESFSFDEQTTDPILRAFTGSSSFVGNVRYNRETQEMRVLLNGKPYTFCGVPERRFDAWEGADSKGAFFAREIKGQFDC